MILGRKHIIIALIIVAVLICVSVGVKSRENHQTFSENTMKIVLDAGHGGLVKCFKMRMKLQENRCSRFCMKKELVPLWDKLRKSSIILIDDFFNSKIVRLCDVLCACFLQQSGVDYILVECEGIAKGITKNTTVQITFLHGLIYVKLIKSAEKEKCVLMQEGLEEYESCVGALSAISRKKCVYLFPQKY